MRSPDRRRRRRFEGFRVKGLSMSVENEPIRYGVVGLGRAGWDIHVRQLRARSDAKIVAVADPMEQRREQAKAELNCAAHDSLRKLLRRDDIEVVVIATPSDQHAKDTI